MAKLLNLIHRLEDALLVSLLGVMILLAFVQIVSRNLFDSGFLWIDPTLRVLVLWLGLVGAMVATRDNRHIRIDLLHSFFKKNTHRAIQTGVELFSALVCLTIAWHGYRWILWDYEDGTQAYAGIPAWVLEIVIPATFMVIGVRYLIRSGVTLKDFFYYRQHPEADETS